MDPDDYLCEDSYEKMYKLAIKEDFDIVIGNALRYDEYSSWKEVLVGTVYDNIEEEVTSTHITKHTKLIYDTGPWNKLFKRELPSAPDAEISLFIASKNLFLSSD